MVVKHMASHWQFKHTWHHAAVYHTCILVISESPKASGISLAFHTWHHAAEDILFLPLSLSTSHHWKREYLEIPLSGSKLFASPIDLRCLWRLGIEHSQLKIKRKVVCQHGPSRRPAPPGSSQRGDGVYWLRAEESGPLTGNSPRPRRGSGRSGGGVKAKKRGKQRLGQPALTRDGERGEYRQYLQNIKDWRIFSDVQFGRKEYYIIILDNVEKNNRVFFCLFDVPRPVQLTCFMILRILAG